jgi:hypothetical protein
MVLTTLSIIREGEMDLDEFNLEMHQDYQVDFKVAPLVVKQLFSVFKEPPQCLKNSSQTAFFRTK